MRLTKEKRLAIAAPRSFAKSTIYSVFYPLFSALEQDKPQDILLISAASHLSEWWLAKIKHELESNQNLIHVFGDQRSGIWRQDQIELKNGTVIRARGAECKVRGMRPSIVIVDDLESEESVWSETTRSRLSDWFWKTLVNVLNPEAQLIMIGTLLHPLAILTKLIEKPPEGWTTKKYTALMDDGSSIWPSKWPTWELKKRKDEIGTAAFEQEYQNNPIPDDWRCFNERQFKYYDTLPPYCAFFTAVDPSLNLNAKGNNTPDYTAIITVAVDAVKDIYVAELTKRRMLPDETIEEVIKHYTKYDSEVVGIETVAFQKILKYALEEECNRRGLHPFIKELRIGTMRKRYRIERLQPYFEKGKIFFNKNMAYLDDLKSELISFPAGQNDDCIDALASVITLIHKGGTAKPDKAPEGSFDQWWFDFKKRKHSHRIRSNLWSNLKIRGCS